MSIGSPAERPPLTRAFRRPAVLAACYLLCVAGSACWAYGTGSAWQRAATGPRDALLLALLWPAAFVYLLAQHRRGDCPDPRGTRVLFDALFLGVVPGAVFFVAAWTTNRVDPRSFAWLMRGDPATHFLGWHFFRNEPWTLPPGLVMNYGAPAGTSIGYTDSIPLMAFLFKPFSGLLPEDFQYFGLWIMLCCLLQGLFAHLLLRCLTPSAPLQLLGGALFVMNPIMATRSLCHLALSAQWIVLAGVLLACRRSAGLRWKTWLSLAAVASLVHTYLWAMTVVLCLADLARLVVVERRVGIRIAFAFAAGVCGVSIACQWAAGLFSIPAASATCGRSVDSCSFYSMNLSSLFNPCGWSTLLAGRPWAAPGQYEGYCYLGAGIWVVVFWALYILLARRNRWPAARLRPFVPLILACVLLTVYAVSNVITFDQRTLCTYQSPSLLYPLYGLFRASGRFFWPVYYVIIYSALGAVLSRTRPHAATVLLGAAVLLQIADFRNLFVGLQAAGCQQPEFHALDSAPWRAAAAKYHRVAMVPQVHAAERYEVLAHYAASHRMPFNSGYFARFDAGRFEAEARDLARRVEAADLDPDTIYVITDRRMAERLAARCAGRYRMESLDGFQVVFPKGL